MDRQERHVHRRHADDDAGIGTWKLRLPATMKNDSANHAMSPTHNFVLSRGD
jgi:hypothetical protein